MKAIHVLRYENVEPVLYDDMEYRAGKLSNHLHLLREEGFESISCVQAYASLSGIGDIPEKSVLITFDHGLRHYFDFAIDPLIKYGFTATFFIYGEHALKSTCKNAEYAERFMDVDNLRHLNALGFDLGLHAYNYDDFSELTLTEISATVENSIAFFEKFSLQHANVFAYHNRFSSIRRQLKWVSQMLTSLNIQMAFQTSGKPNMSTGNRYTLNRQTIGEDWSGERLKKLLYAK